MRRTAGERRRGRRLGRRLQQSDLVREHEALSADALDRHGDEHARRDQLLAQCCPAWILGPLRIGLGRADAAEDVAAAADAEEPVGAVA